jgi:hypothetical protein
MRLIKLWDNADKEILIDMDFKPETASDRSKVFHKFLLEFAMVMAVFAIIFISF